MCLVQVPIEIPEALHGIGHMEVLGSVNLDGQLKRAVVALDGFFLETGLAVDAA